MFNAPCLIILNRGAVVIVCLGNIFDSEFSTNYCFLLLFLFFLEESGSPESRVNAIHFLVHKLPEKNKEMLDILVKHLTK